MIHDWLDHELDMDKTVTLDKGFDEGMRNPQCDGLFLICYPQKLDLTIQISEFLYLQVTVQCPSQSTLPCVPSSVIGSHSKIIETIQHSFVYQIFRAVPRKSITLPPPPPLYQNPYP